MAKSSLDWALVRSFLAVLEGGSLSAAARRLGAQQPTLGRQIAELEAQLGAPLFERTGRGVLPTPLAHEIAEAARQMQAGADDLLRKVAARRDAATGTVRIATSQVAATWLLPPLLTRLRREAPGIAIELVSSNEVNNLLRREADIAVRMVRPEQGALVARKLGDIPIVAAAHADYLAAHGEPATVADLAHHSLIGFDRDDSITRGFARMGVQLPPEGFALRTDDQVAYGMLVAAGAGIGFVTDYVWPRWPGVRTVLPSLRIPPLPCWLAVHREVRTNRLVRQVCDFLADVVPEVIAGSARPR